MSSTPLDSTFDPEAHDVTYPGTDPIFLGSDPSADPMGTIESPDATYPGIGAALVSQGMTPTTPWEVPEWQYDEVPGFYVHSGNVYISGRVSAYSDGSYPGSATLFTGIPPEYAPETTITSRVLVDHTNITYEYAFDSVLHLNPWLLVTITPDGNVVLENGNPFRTPPSSDDWSVISLILSSITWPLASQIYDAYGQTGLLDEWAATAANILTQFVQVSPDIWNNIDNGSYSAHDERLHLNGKLEVVGDWPAHTYDALIGIPFEHQPKASSESVSGDWYQVAQRDGYIFQTPTAVAGSRHALDSNLGAQNPAAIGNNGCGAFAKYFYERISDGSLTRGSNSSTTFTPSPSDAGTSYQFCKGAPVSDLPAVAQWNGNLYHVDFVFTIADLIDTPRDMSFGGLLDYSLIYGANQLSFVCGWPEEGLGGPLYSTVCYYKVVYTYDSGTGDVLVHLLLEEGGDTGRARLLIRVWNPGVGIGPSTPIHTGFTLQTSPIPTDVSYPGVPPAGCNCWNFAGGGGGYVVGNDLVSTYLPGHTVPHPAFPKGDMGFNIPPGSSVSITHANISGLGKFPVFAEGDVIDFTDCGWPLL